MCVHRWAGLYICVCGRASDGCMGECTVSVYACACMCANVYIYESEQGASKKREPTGGEEKERKSRLIRETRMRKGSNCQPDRM